MARPRTGGNVSMTISELENLLDNRRRKLDELKRDRDKLQRQLDTIDSKISSLNGRGGRRTGGGGNGSAAGRTKNAQSLVSTIETVLRGSGNKPMNVGDIVQGVQSAGYRSSSANFRALLNQTLIKDKRFSSAGRGMYHIKK